MASLGCLRVCVRGGGRWMGRGSHYSILACLRGGGRPAASVCGRGVHAVLVQHVTPCADIYTRLYRLAAPCRVVSLLHVGELPFVLPLSVRGMRGMLESLSVYTVSLYDKCILYSVCILSTRSSKPNSHRAGLAQRWYSYSTWYRYFEYMFLPVLSVHMYSNE